MHFGLYFLNYVGHLRLTHVTQLIFVHRWWYCIIISFDLYKLLYLVRPTLIYQALYILINRFISLNLLHIISI